MFKKDFKTVALKKIPQNNDLVKISNANTIQKYNWRNCVLHNHNHKKHRGLFHSFSYEPETMNPWSIFIGKQISSGTIFCFKFPGVVEVKL